MKHRVAAKKGVACKEEGNVSAPLLSPQPLPFWPKLADTAGHRQRAPAVQTMSSSMGSVRSLSSKFHADTCNIDDVITHFVNLHRPAPHPKGGIRGAGRAVQ